MNLDEIRSRINDLDSQLLDLFIKRMELCKDVAKY
ncbi:MAG: chorismate mutase, partial [Huintestinicola sp.]